MSKQVEASDELLCFLGLKVLINIVQVNLNFVQFLSHLKDHIDPALCFLWLVCPPPGVHTGVLGLRRLPRQVRWSRQPRIQAEMRPKVQRWECDCYSHSKAGAAKQPLAK